MSNEKCQRQLCSKVTVLLYINNRSTIKMGAILPYYLLQFWEEMPLFSLPIDIRGKSSTDHGFASVAKTVLISHSINITNHSRSKKHMLQCTGS